MNYTEGGLRSILRLGQGDMRRVLNVVQVVFLQKSSRPHLISFSPFIFFPKSASMAFECVDERAVYLVTGKPEPAVIEQVMKITFYKRVVLRVGSLSLSPQAVDVLLNEPFQVSVCIESFLGYF